MPVGETTAGHGRLSPKPCRSLAGPPNRAAEQAAFSITVITGQALTRTAVEMSFASQGSVWCRRPHELATEDDVSRREAMDLGLMAAAAVTLRAGAVPDRTMAPQLVDVFVSIVDRGASLRAEPFRVGAAPVLAWPMDPKGGVERDGARFNQMILLRVAADTWDEIAAFPAICPHARMHRVGVDGSNLAFAPSVPWVRIRSRKKWDGGPQDHRRFRCPKP
jgi:hypothetical protein